MKFGISPNKTFRGDLEIMLQAIKDGEHFAFAKFADGELAILANQYIDLTQKCFGEFKYDPNDPSDDNYRKLLLASFQYNSPGYHVGIGCPCCIGETNAKLMAEMSLKSDDQITWTNLIVNGNYEYYCKYVIPAFLQYDIFLVCNHQANIRQLPFKDKLTRVWQIGTNAWKENLDLIDTIRNISVENALFLFAAGPFGSMLCHQLYLFSPVNTYIDIGSTLDPWLFGCGTRGYHFPGSQTRNKICQWI